MFGRTQYYQHLNVGSIYIEVQKDTCSSALQTESTKLRNENCTIHVKRTRSYYHFDFQHFQD